MNSTFGNKIKYSLFGESHGQGIGITMHGVPSGVYIDMQNINKNMKRRMHHSALSTKRKEADKIHILSGEKDGYTTGSPLTFYIKNENIISKDYATVYNKPRPSHADYAQLCKYGDFVDLRGSGHLSARLTAPIVAAGSFLMNLEELKNISVARQIYRIGEIADGNPYDYSILDNMSTEQAEAIKDLELGIIDEDTRKKATEEILKAIEHGNSLGSKLKFSIRGLQAGIGNPFFDSLESTLAHLLFSIPAVKAVEFGLGSDFAKTKGSEANDSFIYHKDSIMTSTNKTGGINGGISNGMPINFSVTFRPTPTIAMEQDTVDLKNKTNCKITMQGRHDACVGVRAGAVVEAMCYIAVYDLL